MAVKHYIIYGMYFDLNEKPMAFYGSIFVNECQNSNPLLSGEVFDALGFAELFDIELTNNTFKFKKRYQKRPEIIVYEYQRAGNHWIGEYHGQMGDTGNTRCALFIAHPSITFYHPCIIAEQALRNKNLTNP